MVIMSSKEVPPSPPLKRVKPNRYFHYHSLYWNFYLNLHLVTHSQFSSPASSLVQFTTVRLKDKRLILKVLATLPPLPSKFDHLKRVRGNILVWESKFDDVTQQSKVEIVNR